MNTEIWQVSVFLSNMTCCCVYYQDGVISGKHGTIAPKNLWGFIRHLIRFNTKGVKVEFFI